MNIHLKKATLKNKNWVSDKVLYLKFQTHDEFSFIPGQFISVKVNDQNYRAYSLCSNPANKNTFEIIADAKHQGKGSNYFRALNINDDISYIGPAGRFLLPKNLKNNLVFVATGTGISPFISMLYQIRNLNLNPVIKIYFGLRNKENIFFEDKLKEFSNSFEKFEYRICLSKELVKGYFNGRVTNHVDYNNINETQYFLCGNPDMVNELKNTLLEQGINTEDVFFEKFTTAVPY